MNAAYHLDYLCDDLIANQRVYDDNIVFATLVIERLIESPSIDLLAVAPYVNFASVMNKLETLIGFNSAPFKTICAHEDLFERFLKSFCTMVKRTYVQEPHYFHETAYEYFLSAYLENLLPTNDLKLATVKNSDWFVANPLSNPLVNSPLKLLRPEVLESSFASEMTYVPTFRNLYPKLYQFINNLIKHLTTLETWPNIMQLVTLKHLMEHYYKFLIAETNDRDFMSFKMNLRKKPPFYHMVYDFLRRMLEDWPIDWTYITIVDLWKFLAFPRNLFPDEIRLRQFMASSPSPFGDLIETIVMRVLDTDVSSQTAAPFIEYLLEEIFTDANIQLLEDHEWPLADYLILIREKVRMAIDVEKIKVAAQQKTKLTFLESVLKYLQLLTRFDSPASPMVIARLDKYFADTTNKLNRLSVTNESILNVTNAYDVSLSPAKDSPMSPSKIPDYEIDRRTKLMHLTPPGRAQVITRQAKFDFNQCSKNISQLYPGKKPWQSTTLYKLFEGLSTKYNNSQIGRYLRYNRMDSFVAKWLSKVFLRPAPAPKYVPVFTKNVSRTHYRLDLTIFSNYFVAAIIVWILFSLFVNVMNILL